MTDVVVRRSQTPRLGLLLVALGVVAFGFAATVLEDYDSKVVYLAVGLAALLALAGTNLIVLFAWQDVRHGRLALKTSAPARPDGVSHIVDQLAKNYDLLRAQTTQGFLVSSVMVVLGVLVILAGSFGSLLGLDTPTSRLTTVAGIVAELIAGPALVLYRLNFTRLNVTTDQLTAALHVQTAHQLAQGLPEDKRAQATLQIVELLMHQSRQGARLPQP